MYIKLTIKFIPLVIAHVAAGLNAVLAKKPEIVGDLPEGARANVHSEKLRTMMSKDLVQAGYYHDCEELTLGQVEKALEIFANHYNNYNDDKLPGTALNGLNPSDNEIIVNLKIALENVRTNTETPLLKNWSSDDGEDQLNSNFY